MYRPALRLGIKDSGPREWSVSAINKLKTNERKIFTYLISSHEKTANEHSLQLLQNSRKVFLYIANKILSSVVVLLMSKKGKNCVHGFS